MFWLVILDGGGNAVFPTVIESIEKSAEAFFPIATHTVKVSGNTWVRGWCRSSAHALHYIDCQISIDLRGAACERHLQN